MKVLLIPKWVAGATKGDFYYPGEWRDTYELALALKRKKVDVHILTSQVYPPHRERFWQEFGRNLKNKGIHHHFAKTFLAFGSGWGLFRWQLFFAELRLVYKIKPDIIQYMQFGSSLLFPFVGSTPILAYSCHLFNSQQKLIDFKMKKKDWSLAATNPLAQLFYLGFDLLYLLFSRLIGARGIRQLAQRRTILVFMHKEGYEEAKEKFSHQTQIIYIPKGVNLRAARQAEARKNHLRLAQNTIFYFGRLYYSRGIFDLLKAFKMVSKKIPARLLIAGSGPETLVRKIKGTIRAFGRKVRYVGSVSFHKKWDLFYQSTIFCLPSYQDAYPGAMLEAMACGVPVITTFEIDSPIKNGVSGLKVPRGNIKELAAAIIELLQSTRKRRALAKKARQTIASFSWDETARRFIAFYKKIS